MTHSAAAPPLDSSYAYVHQNGPAESSGRGTASLVLGILGVTGVLPLLGPLLALILGHGEPGSAARGGRILGWIAIVFQLLLVFGALLFVGLLGGLSLAA